MTEAPKNESDAKRLADMARLINQECTVEFLRMAYALGLHQGELNGVTQAHDLLRERSA